MQNSILPASIRAAGAPDCWNQEPSPIFPQRSAPKTDTRFPRKSFIGHQNPSTRGVGIRIALRLRYLDTDHQTCHQSSGRSAHPKDLTLLVSHGRPNVSRRTADPRVATEALTRDDLVHAETMFQFRTSSQSHNCGLGICMHDTYCGKRGLPAGGNVMFLSVPEPPAKIPRSPSL